MFDITRLTAALEASMPLAKVELTSELFNDVQYPDPSLTVIRVDVPSIVSLDTNDLLLDTYAALGSLLTGVIKMNLITPVNRLYLDFAQVQDALLHFFPVPENENYGGLVLNTAGSYAIKNKISMYYMEWQYSFPRIV